MDNTDARYEAFAKAEAYMINNSLAVPCYYDVRWCLTHVNEYTKINAMFGPCNFKYVNWETSEDAYTTAQYEEFAKLSTPQNLNFFLNLFRREFLLPACDPHTGAVLSPRTAPVVLFLGLFILFSSLFITVK